LYDKIVSCPLGQVIDLAQKEEEGRNVMKATPASNPPVSIWPILLAAGLTLVIAGVVTHLAVSILGILLLLISLGGWMLENRSLGFNEIDDEDEARHE
jgi:hypothetical protein